MDNIMDIPIYKSLPEKVLSNTEVSYLSPIDIQQLYVNEPFIDYNKNNNIIYFIITIILLFILLFSI
jgi:hypothetical protein